jgi:hypothetical protein
MKIEVGKFYKTRDGSEVRVYAVDGGGFDKIHGAILQGNNWSATQWNSDGKWTKALGVTAFDIVSEQEEPKEKKMLYPALVRVNGDYVVTDCLYDTELRAKDDNPYRTVIRLLTDRGVEV